MEEQKLCFEFVDAISDVVLGTTIVELQKAPFHTLIVDESTDITINKMLVLYFKYREHESVDYKTVFGGIVQLTGCTAASLETALRKFYCDHNLDINCLIMLTSDGASVMLGRHNGLAALLKRSIPHLTEQHCVAYRENFALTASWNDSELMKKIEVLLRTVYKQFSRSSVKTSALKELADVNDMEVLSFKPIKEVRWLSRHFAVRALVKNIDALVLYCEEQIEESNDPVCIYILQSLKNPQYLFALYTLNDVLFELANLTQSLQKANLSPLEAHQYCISKIKKLEGQHLSDVAFWNEKSLEILRENAEIDTTQMRRFIRSLLDHLTARFQQKS